MKSRLGAQNVGQQRGAQNVEQQQGAQNVGQQQRTKKGLLKVQDISRDSSNENFNQQKPLPSFNIGASKSNPLKILMLREKSSMLLGKSKYEEAVPILKELTTLQNHQDLDTLLMMIECFIQLGRTNEAEMTIDNLRNILITSSAASADDVKDFAMDLISNSAHICSIILLRIASDMYKARARSPDDVINGIESCVSKIDDATRPMIEAGGRSETIARDYGIEYKMEMLDDIRIIKNAAQNVGQEQGAQNVGQQQAADNVPPENIVGVNALNLSPRNPETHQSGAIKKKVGSIGVEGGSMNLNECDITFLPGTFNKQTKVWITATSDNSICPEGYVCISPVFDISAESKFLKDAIIRIKSWCIDLDKVDILHFPNKNTWHVIEPDQISKNGIIHFRCRKFSPLTAAIEWLVGMIWQPQIVVDNCLYILNGNDFHFIFYAKSETAREDIGFHYKEIGAQLAPVWFDPIVLKLDERVRVGVQIQPVLQDMQIQPGPENLQFVPPRAQFTCDGEFLSAQRRKITFQLLPKLQKFPERNIQCKIEKNEMERERQHFTFPVKPVDGDQARQINVYGDIHGDVHMMGQGNEHLHQPVQQAQHEQVEENEEGD